MLQAETAARQRMRHDMVEHQIAARGISDTYVLEAMKAVPRDVFLPGDADRYAYEDTPVPIGYGQTMSQPFIVALMAELAALHPTDRVLEIGTGSGYGAAILGQIAHDVFTLERHKALAAQAENTLRDLDYTNIRVLQRDGSEGLPEEAPFDAIIVTAGAPNIPAALKEQLAIGGRLVIPVGRDERRQNLQRITRLDEDRFETENFGPVGFVPLVGKYGWREKVSAGETRPAAMPFSFLRQDRGNRNIVSLLAQDAEPLPDPDSPHFGQFFDRLADAKIVLLGESTHGTSEFYRARAAITMRLIRNHGFNVVACEADWPDMAVMDSYVRGREAPKLKQQAFSRFPEWMWRNREFALLIDWLKKHNNMTDDPAARAGLYGLDVYSLEGSINAVIGLLEKKDPELAAIARTRYGCFAPWLDDPVNYGRAAVTEQFRGCEQEAVNMLMDLMAERVRQDGISRDDFLDLTRNAEAVVNAEKYYRIMFMSSASSWNLRDRHMFGTLRAILDSRGPQAKAVVWAHNSHIGDARATEMGTVRGELNLGQLCRENFGGEAKIVGFGTASGQVAAADYWGGPMEIKTLRTPLPGSYEDLWSKTRLASGLLDISGGLNEDLQKALEEERLQRAVGVIYRPESERISHYFGAHPARQFDCYVWFQQTNAVKPLEFAPEEKGAPETYPFGV